jgi:hypothetical protein
VTEELSCDAALTTRSTVSPGMFESLGALGRYDSIERIDRAIGRLRDGLPGDDDDPG